MQGDFQVFDCTFFNNVNLNYRLLIIQWYQRRLLKFFGASPLIFSSFKSLCYLKKTAEFDGPDKAQLYAALDARLSGWSMKRPGHLHLPFGGNVWKQLLRSRNYFGPSLEAYYRAGRLHTPRTAELVDLLKSVDDFVESSIMITNLYPSI